MRKPSGHPRSAKPPMDGDGNHIANSILLLLSSKECEEVLAKLELVRLKLHQVSTRPEKRLSPAIS